MIKLTSNQLKTLITTKEFMALIHHVEPKSLYRRRLLTDPEFRKVRDILSDSRIFKKFIFYIKVVANDDGELSLKEFSKYTSIIVQHVRVFLEENGVEY